MTPNKWFDRNAPQPVSQCVAHFSCLGLNLRGDKSHSNLLSVGPCFEEAAMLAEIFFLRLETMARALEAAQVRNSRFVPLPRDVSAGLRGSRAKDDEKSV
jgi:hypothetical protein